MKLRIISSFESGCMASMKIAEVRYGSGKLKYQSKSCLSGIKKARQTKVATMLNSLRKVAHRWTCSTSLNFLLIVSKNRFDTELRWNIMTASLKISVQTPKMVDGWWFHCLWKLKITSLSSLLTGMIETIRNAKAAR